MNERIKELAQQAAEEVIGLTPEAIMVTETDTDKIEVPDTFIHRFAELMLADFQDVLTKVYQETSLELVGPLLTLSHAVDDHFYTVDNKSI